MKPITISLLILVACTQGAAQVPYGVFKSKDGQLFSIGEIEGRPVVIFSNGEVRGLRPSQSPNVFEIGNSVGMFDAVEGHVEFSEKGNAILKRQKGDVAGEKIAIVENEVNFKNQKTTLAGTLIQPEGPGPFPCIVFTHGSGAQTRESERGFANFFASQGIAALIFDKRGTGKSSGKDWQDSFDNYAGDAIAGAEFLQTQSTIDKQKIGIYGHSQGGWITPLAVSKSNLFSFAIISAANATSPVEQHLAAGDEEYRMMGMDEATLKEVHAFRLLKYKVGITGEGLGEYKKVQLPDAEKKSWFKSTGANLPEGTFWKANGFYDPTPALKAMKCPVLVIYGALDISTNTERNLPLMKSLIGSKEAEYMVFENANHMMMKVEKKGYASKQLPFVKQFADGYFDTLINWTKRVTENK